MTATNIQIDEFRLSDVPKGTLAQQMKFRANFLEFRMCLNAKQTSCQCFLREVVSYDLAIIN